VEPAVVCIFPMCLFFFYSVLLPLDKRKAACSLIICKHISQLACWCLAVYLLPGQAAHKCFGMGRSQLTTGIKSSWLWSSKRMHCFFLL